MFRKLHSNRDPRDTLLKEIRKEFSVYFGKAESGIKSILQQYPKHVYGAMLVLMLLSLVLSFTVFRNLDPVPKPSIAGKDRPLSPVSGGFDQILQTTSGLKQTLELKQQIDTLLSKGILTKADSIQLAVSLEKLQHLQQSLQPQP